MSYSSHSFDNRDGRRERLNSTNVKVVRTSGFVTTTGAGEGVLDVAFACIYIEKPALSMGGELTGNTLLVAGSYPTVSVIVGSWVISPVTPTGTAQSVVYTGARLIIVTTGDPAQQVIVHWQAEGRALASPIPGTGTA